jgi:hypothetical protein
MSIRRSAHNLCAFYAYDFFLSLLFFIKYLTLSIFSLFSIEKRFHFNSHNLHLITPSGSDSFDVFDRHLAKGKLITLPQHFHKHVMRGTSRSLRSRSIRLSSFSSSFSLVHPAR